MTATLLRRIAVPAMLAALLTALAFAGSASATPLVGSIYDSQDGDQLTGPGAIKDWQDVASAARLTTNLDNQAIDDCFIGGNKEDTPSAWNFNVSSGGCTPGKSDLLGMWSQAELTSTASILHAAFVRNAPTGNTFITFELNKVGTTWTNSVGATIPCRSTGDLLLAYDIGGGSTVSVTIYRWTGDGSGPIACPDGATGTFTSSTAANNGLINAAAIANYLSPGTIGATIGANLFGEAQIDVASVLASMGVSGCFSYVQAQAHTRSSSSISSALIDNVKPVATKVANCGVTGTVFGDTNDNGVRDAGEPGSAGRTVYVDLDSDGTQDPGEPSAITDADGAYLIATGLSAGTYPVRVVVPAGNVCTTPAGCAFSDTFNAAGNNSVANDFGLYVPATVSGTAYVDTNGNAVRDAGENTPIAGRTIFNDANNNGALDAGESSTTTAADGRYTVGGLAPGTARIRFVNGGGYVCDLPAGCLHTLAVASGDTPAGRDFLAYQPPTVSGIVYDDADADAVRDGGEGGHSAVVVGLYAADGTTLLATTTTDASGSYAFSTTQYPAFKPGAYVVKVTPPGGLQCSASCATAITLTSGQSLTGQSTGVYATATVAGTVFTDNDVDGVKGPLESGVGAKTVFGDANDNGTLDAGETSATTAADGGYVLSLRPGAVHIRTVLTGADVCTGACRHDLTLTSGEANGPRDFGIYTPSVVTGVVYADIDGDGTKAGVEPGLGARTVFADLNANGAIDAGEPTTTTAGDGTYSLGGIRPGSAVVRVVTSGAQTCTSPATCSVAHLFVSGSSFGASFGIWVPASVSGSVYEDANADGTLGGAEPALGGRTVFDDANDNGSPDAGEAQANSAPDGTYTLAGLAPGAHRIRATLPAGFTRTEPGGAGAHVLTLTSGQSATARNFGGYRDATVSGHLYVDTDGDHVHQGVEPALGGQTVRLYAADGTTLLASTTTDGAGTYQFTGLIPAGYVVKLGLTGGYVCSSPAPCTQPLTVASGQTAGGQDFTAYVPATVSGTAYTDSDNDATQDAGELAKAGVVVYADLDADGIRDAGEPTATTDAGGAYTIAGIPPGAVHVRADLAAGFACSTPTGCDHALTLTSGETRASRDFGIVQGSIASGRVAVDNDADGIVDAGEPPLAGWTVYVDANANGQPDPGEPFDVTAADGGYTIANVTPGTRLLRVDRPAGWTCSSPCSRSVAFTSGDTTSGLDFALYQPVSVAGTVFEDQDADGTRDAADAGIAGRVVYLDANDDGNQDAGEPTDTTDASGHYAFAGLAPGIHHVRTVMPAGWTCSTPSGCAHALTQTSGDGAAGRDFGVYRDVTVAGRIYADADADGTRDAGESPLAGRTVYLDLDGDGTPDPGEPTATTDASGDYAFAGLQPGTYTVRLVLDPGERCTGGCSAAVTLTSGETDGPDIGAWTDATVSGTAFADDDANGVADAGDGPRAGVTVYADLDANGSRDAGEPTATTDASGGYTLDLAPGTYTIRIDTPAGEHCSICSHPVTLTSGEVAGGRDFGLYAPATVTGQVTDDTDADASADAGEPGLAGRTVWADLDGNGTHDAGEPSTTTGAGGDYTLSGLEPGSYVMRVELPAGWHCSPACGSGVTVGSGDAPAIDFAQWREATIGGTVYGDADNSASRDPGEDGLGGRTVELDRGADGTVDATTTTAGDGSYAFAGLTPGSVRITVVLPAGWTCSTPSPCRIDRTPGSGTVSSAVDFGHFRPDVADLSLTKSAPATVDQGDTFAYVLTVTNNGPDAAQNAVVVDPLPGGVQFVSADAGCVEAAGTVTCSLGTIANGASATRSITVRAVDAGNVANNATVSSDTGDPTPANDADGASVDVTPVADVSITKTGPANVAAGADATYTLTASNAGPSTAHGVVVGDALPAGMTFVSLAAPGGVSCTTPAVGAGGSVQCTAPSLADGASIALTLVARAGFATAGQTLTNTATVHADELDGDGANDSASASTTVGPASDLRLQKTASVPALPQNHQLTYTLTATNDGPSAATNVVVGDPLPAGVSFVSASAGCVNAAGTVTCALGTIADGASASATITVTATANGTRVNTATVASDNPDPDPSDNAGSVTVLVGPTADLSIAKTGPATVTAGGELTYVLTAANHGPSPATGVTVTDQLPAGIAYVSSTASQGSCAAAGQTITCAVGSLADGASTTITVTAHASFAIAGQTATNSATIAGQQNDDDTSDDSAVHAVDVGPAADLTFVKDAPEHVPAGGQLVYSLRVANAGPQTATNVVVADTLPAGVRFASATSTQGTCSAAGQTVTCAIGSVPVGGGAQVVLTVDVDAAEGGHSLHNTAHASSDTTEIDASSNSDDATTAVDAVPAGAPPAPAGTLTVTKTADAGPDASAPVGSPVAFTIRVANVSAGTAHGVVAIDQPSAPASVGSMRPDRGTCANLRCELGDLVPGDVVLIHVVMTPTRTGTLTNSATVFADDGGAVKDDAVNVAVVAHKTNLRLTKTASLRSVGAGKTVWYTITTKNVGGYPASNLRICDVPAPRTAYVSVRGAKFSGGRPCWKVKLLMPGKSVAFRFKVRVFEGSQGPMSRTRASVSASNASPRRAARAVRVVGQAVSPAGGVTG
ncbi:MAG: hypothetical protein QOJ35_1487 [Solirubrobacteraceae bacterium]|jgi:uncharacterized repeat protein (TIGR01451 family)|nr:hypothetical protein [Solirubrobacteraceae bacterium]